MKVQNAKIITSTENNSVEVELPALSLAKQEAAFFADTAVDGDVMNPRTKIHRLNLIRYSTDHIKTRLRKTLVQSLAGGMMVPEVIEGLVEYLTDLVQEDPRQARLFGVYD